MSAVHLHLLVNHLPILGTLFALPLLALALWRRDERAYLVSAVLLLVVASGSALVASRSGEGAEEVAERLPAVTEGLIEEHEERAEIATPLSVVVGLAGIALLAWQAVRAAPPPRAAIGGLLAATVAASGAMAWTGAAGGRIRHTEIRADFAGGAAVPVSPGAHVDDD